MVLRNISFRKLVFHFLKAKESMITWNFLTRIVCHTSRVTPKIYCNNQFGRISETVRKPRDSSFSVRIFKLWPTHWFEKNLPKLKASLEFKHVMHASSFKVPFHLTEMYSDEGPISTFCTEDCHSLVINLILEKLVPRDFSLFVSLWSRLAARNKTRPESVISSKQRRHRCLHYIQF